MAVDQADIQYAVKEACREVSKPGKGGPTSQRHQGGDSRFEQQPRSRHKETTRKSTSEWMLVAAGCS